jgi:trk system potassium uptake protein TrkH
VLIITLGAEALGVLALWPAFSQTSEPLFNAVFHSVSAFCNAGFSLFDDSFASHTSSWGLNAILMILITVGGLGFIVMDDLFARLTGGRGSRQRVLGLHARIVLWSSLILTLVGAVGFYLLEVDGVLADQSEGDRWVTAGFQSISSRTAGFSSVDFGGEGQAEGLSSSTRVFLMGFMLIGASPGSTGGGMKTVTVVLLLASIIALLRGSDSVNLLGRRIPDTLIKKAGAIVVIYGVTISAAVFALSITDSSFGVLDLAFEAVSAVGTVGFSVGVSGSQDFSDAGKVILTALMYLGRLGPLTIVMMATRIGSAPVVQYPEERVMIG